MPTTRSRTLRIQYGSYVIGGESAAQLDGFHEVRQGFETSELAFTAVIDGSSESDFASKVRSIEGAFREPSRDLRVTLGDNELLSWKHTENTGFDAEPEIVKQGAVGDSARSRWYRIRIVIGRPADVGPQPKGMRRIATEITYSPSRRATVRIEGVATAIGANTSKAQYDAQIGAIVTARLAALSSTFELVDEQVEYDTHNKVAEFRRTYREVIFSQAGSSPDDAQLVEQSLRIRATQTDSESSEFASELTRVEAAYDVSVDKTLTTDLAGKYADPIREWLLARMVEVLGGSSYGIVEEDPAYDPDENRIRVRMVIIGPAGSSDTLAVRSSVEDEVDEGRVLVPAWDANRWSKHRFQGTATYIRRVRETRTVTGSLSASDARERAGSFVGSARNQPKSSEGGDTPTLWNYQGSKTSSVVRKIGLDSGTQFDVTDIISLVELHGYDVPASESPGDGGVVTAGKADGAGFGANDGSAVTSGTQTGVSPNV